MRASGRHRAPRRDRPNEREANVAQPDPSSVRNPDWTREETILALEAYQRVRPRFAGERDDVIIELSELLRTYAEQRGVAGAATFRNAFGVARKVNKFHAAEAGRPPSAVRGSKLEPVIWAEFHNAPNTLTATAMELRRQIYALEVEVGVPVEMSATVSRGPAPSFGAVVSNRADSECVVYVLRLTGPTELLFPDRSLAGLAVVKIGRSNAVGRRTVELNAGFPPSSALGWRVYAVRLFAGAQAAHDVEQALLRRLAARGLSVGREFAIVREDGLDQLLIEPTTV